MLNAHRRSELNVMSTTMYLALSYALYTLPHLTLFPTISFTFSAYPNEE